MVTSSYISFSTWPSPPKYMVHPPSYENSYAYSLYPHSSLSPPGFMVPPLHSLWIWSRTNFYAIRITVISMLMSHPASNIISPCGLHLHFISFPPSPSLLWSFSRPCHHLECFFFWNINPLWFLKWTTFQAPQYLPPLLTVLQSSWYLEYFIYSQSVSCI